MLSDAVPDAFLDGGSVVEVDLAGATSALFEILRRRTAGVRAKLSLRVPERRAAVAALLSPALLAQCRTLAERRVAFDQLAAEGLTVNNAPQRALLAPSDDLIGGARAALLAADALCVRSQAEAARLSALLGVASAALVIEPRSVGSPVGGVLNAERDLFVVWAPTMSGAALGTYIAALDDAEFPIVVVCADGLLDARRMRAVMPWEAESVLSRALAVVVADADDPGPALGLIELGVPLAVSESSGAAEYLIAAALFHPWDRRSINRAARIALGAGMRDAPPETNALVSVVVATMNRMPALLARTLRSISAQTYQHVETIVVNDGTPLDSASLRAPKLRIIERSAEGGLASARNAAIAVARGTYVAFLDDDDVYLPDHLSSAVRALESSGAVLAHADFAYASLDESGPVPMVGGLDVARQTYVPEELLISNQLGVLTVVLRRDALIARGFDETFHSAEDYELWMYLAPLGIFVHTGKCGAIYSVRAGSMSNTRSAMFADTYARIYARYPVADGALKAARDKLLATFYAQGAGPPLMPRPLPEPIPLANLDVAF